MKIFNFLGIFYTLKLINTLRLVKLRDKENFILRLNGKNELELYDYFSPKKRAGMIKNEALRDEIFRIVEESPIYIKHRMFFFYFHNDLYDIVMKSGDVLAVGKKSDVQYDNIRSHEVIKFSHIEDSSNNNSGYDENKMKYKIRKRHDDEKSHEILAFTHTKTETSASTTSNLPKLTFNLPSPKKSTPGPGNSKFASMFKRKKKKNRIGEEEQVETTHVQSNPAINTNNYSDYSMSPNTISSNSVSNTIQDNSMVNSMGAGVRNTMQHKISNNIQTNIDNNLQNNNMDNNMEYVTDNYSVHQTPNMASSQLSYAETNSVQHPVQNASYLETNSIQHPVNNAVSYSELNSIQQPINNNFPVHHRSVEQTVTQNSILRSPYHTFHIESDSSVDHEVEPLILHSYVSGIITKPFFNITNLKEEDETTNKLCLTFVKPSFIFAPCISGLKTQHFILEDLHETLTQIKKMRKREKIDDSDDEESLIEKDFIEENSDNKTVTLKSMDENTGKQQSLIVKNKKHVLDVPKMPIVEKTTLVLPNQNNNQNKKEIIETKNPSFTVQKNENKKDDNFIEQLKSTFNENEIRNLINI